MNRVIQKTGMVPYANVDLICIGYLLLQEGNMLKFRKMLAGLVGITLTGII